MTSLRRTTIAALLCAGLVPLAACTRTSDGTVVLRNPPAMPNLMPSFFRRNRAAQMEADASFPPAPQPAAQSAAPVTAARSNPRRRKTGFSSIQVAPTAAMACKNEVQPDGRVRVVCK